MLTRRGTETCPLGRRCCPTARLTARFTRTRSCDNALAPFADRASVTARQRSRQGALDHPTERRACKRSPTRPRTCRGSMTFAEPASKVYRPCPTTPSRLTTGAGLASPPAIAVAAAIISAIGAVSAERENADGAPRGGPRRREGRWPRLHERRLWVAATLVNESLARRHRCRSAPVHQRSTGSAPPTRPCPIPCS
jgi:hypothetical protein